MTRKVISSKMDYSFSGKSTKKKSTKKMIGSEQSNLEAEDIVADAIKLNVDDDLNEQRDDNLTDCLSNKNSSNLQNGNIEVLDNANIEDEPNYEVDETEEDEQYMVNDGDEHQNDNVSNQHITDSLIVHADESQCEIDADLDASNVYEQESGNQEKLEDSYIDNSMEKKSEIEKINIKQIESKEVSNKDDRESKKEGNATESDSKSKSSSKDKDSKSLSDKKLTSSNDRNVWVSGLTSNIRASDLQSLFKKYGKVIGAKIIKNTRIPGSRCYGFITMETAEQAEKCIQNLNKTTLDGRTITVEKNRLAEDKKSSRRDRSNERSNSKDNKESDNKRDEDKYRDKRDRSPRRKSNSPFKRFPHKPFPNRRPMGGFNMRRGGGIGGRFMNAPNPMIMRKIEAERLMRRREMRKQERSRVEDYRRQRDIERKQQEERDKLEREKIRLKIERDRLEREKAELLRAEREKARLERERLEREREELRRKQVQLPHRLDDVRGRGNNLNQTKRSYEETSYGWDDRKRFTPNNDVSLRPAYPDLSGNSRYTDYDARPIDYEHRKLDALASTSIGRDYETRRSALESSRSTGHDRDDRRTTGNGSNSQLSYYREPARTNISNRDRDRRSSGGNRDEPNDWKSGTDRRSDARFLEKNILPETNSAPQSYLPVRGYIGDRNTDVWSSNRVQPASSLGKLTYAPVSALTDSRARPQANIQQGIIGPTSTIGMYNPSNVQMSGIITNPNYGNGNIGSTYRRY